MRADIHDGPERTLQSEAGYIDARPYCRIDENLLHRTAGPYIWVKGLNRSRGRPLRLEHTHVIHRPRKLPVVLSVEQVARPSSAV